MQKHLLAERDENTCRKDFTPLEAREMAKAIEPFEKKAAKERQERGINQHSEGSGKLPEASKGEARERVADTVGVSRRTLDKIETVVAAADADPIAFGPIAEEMDRTGKVDPAGSRL